MRAEDVTAPPAVGVFATRFWRSMAGDAGGTAGADHSFAERIGLGFGAEIMGRGKFGPQYGPWADVGTDDEWRGWWGPKPPFHTPVFGRCLWDGGEGLEERYDIDVDYPRPMAGRCDGARSHISASRSEGKASPQPKSGARQRFRGRQEFPAASSMGDHPSMFATVEFPSQGTMLRGRLYRPPGTAPVPVVIMAHGTSATITMTADRYAEAFQESGFAVLLYDHRNFGESGGQPRQEINPWVQARGYRDAITFVASLPAIDPDAIAVWGDSYSAAEVIVVGAVDERPAAVIAQIPAIGPHLPPADPDGALFSALRDTLAQGAVGGGPAETTGPLPVVSADQRGTPSLLTPIQAFRWFIEYGGRHGTNWQNEVTRVLPATPCPFHAGIAAPHLKHPLLMMVAPGDEMQGANPEVSRAAYASVQAPKELVEIGGGHFGLLHHPSELFDYACTVQRQFLERTLS